MAKLPDIIPIFPLPNVVFFPRMPLPLHIFEPRYRAMVRDSVRGARLIGMVLLRQDWEREYVGTPAVFGMGTVGELVRSDELPDGRFNIVLRGVREFVVICDATTNTPDLIDQSIMRGQIFIRPTKAAEIIQIDFVVVDQGTEFSEIISGAA